MLHRFVDLRVLERIQVDLSCGKVGMTEGFRDDRNVHSRTLEYGRIRVSRYVGSQRNSQPNPFSKYFQFPIHLTQHFMCPIKNLLGGLMNHAIQNRENIVLVSTIRFAILFNDLQCIGNKATRNQLLGLMTRIADSTMYNIPMT